MNTGLDAMRQVAMTAQYAAAAAARAVGAFVQGSVRAAEAYEMTRNYRVTRLPNGTIRIEWVDGSDD